MKRVHIIDDSFDDAELISLALNKLPIKMEIIHHHNPQELITAIDNSQMGQVMGLPDLFILDLKLPKISGHEVLKKIRSTPQLKHIPVVVFSTSNQSVDIKLSYNLCANSYIQKPVDANKFERIIKEIGNYWLNTNLCDIQI